MSTVPTIDYERIKGVKNVPLEELYTSGHRTCQGCESATTMRGFIKAAGSRTVVTGATGCMYVANTSYLTTPWIVPWVHTQLGAGGSLSVRRPAGPGAVRPRGDKASDQAAGLEEERRRHAGRRPSNLPLRRHRLRHLSADGLSE